MKYLSILTLVGFALCFFPSSSISQTQNNTSISDYNGALPYWGTTWSAGPKAVSYYYPSFYTGFAMRSQYPDRIQIRLSRGNQTRVSVILDENTITDYLFDLVKRYEFYKKVTSLNNNSPKVLAAVPPEPTAKTLPQLEYYNKIIESSVYGILPFVNEARNGSLTAEQIYAKSIDVLTKLNSGRVFKIHLNLTQEFLKWQTQVRQELAANPTALSNSRTAMTILNNLVFGRVNYVQQPTPEILAKLQSTVALALGNDQASFLTSALELFKLVTPTKYNVRVLSDSGQFQNSLQCADIQNCYLNYYEFTAIYPTGSVMQSTRDQHGNEIHDFSTPGLWRFVSRGSARAVDNIRNEPFYGWAPKMDYEAIGNGYHNPGVRFYGITNDLKKMLGAPMDHKILWTVKRGDVSHGCLRLSTGHIWELRHITPVEDAKLTQMYFFGNQPQDFDLYDINGDGALEVMGVEYYISYGLQGTSDLLRREGTDLKINNNQKTEFLTKLYGAVNVFTIDSAGKVSFTNPSVTVHSYLDFQKKRGTARVTLPGQYPLYEQAYERDKIQLYSSFAETNSPDFKQAVRLLGRVRGCAPTSDKVQCGEAAFDQEASGVLQLVK